MYNISFVFIYRKSVVRPSLQEHGNMYKYKALIEPVSRDNVLKKKNKNYGIFKIGVT